MYVEVKSVDKKKIRNYNINVQHQQQQQQQRNHLLIALKLNFKTNATNKLQNIYGKLLIYSFPENTQALILYIVQCMPI